MDPNTQLNHQLEKNVGCKSSSIHHTMKIKNSLVTKPYGVQAQQLLQEKDELRQILFSVTICIIKTLLHTCATVQPLTGFKIILIYVQGCEKRKLKHILTDWIKISSEKLSFINLNRQPSIKLAVEPQAETAFKSRQMLAVDL